MLTDMLRNLTGADKSLPVTDDIACVQTLIVNSYLVGTRGDGNRWVLVDTGMP